MRLSIFSYLKQINYNFSYLEQINYNQYNVITRIDGVEYTYLVYKKDEIPEVSLLLESFTTKPNGTDISFYVSYYNIHKFKDAIFNQLRFFDGVQIEGIDVNFTPFYKTEHFCIDFNSGNQGVKCVVGKNIYNIDTSKFGLMKEGNVLLYFNVGEVDLVENREQLKYTEKTLNALLEKFNIVRNIFNIIYLEQNDKIESILKWLEKRNQYSTTIKINDFEVNCYPFSIIKNPKLKNFDTSNFKFLVDIDSTISFFFSVKHTRKYKRVDLKDLVVTESFKKFSTYNLSYNNKKAIVNLDLNNSIEKEEHIKFAEQLKKELLESCTHVYQLISRPSYKHHSLKANNEEIKGKILSPAGKKEIILKIKDFVKNKYKYIIYTNEKNIPLIQFYYVNNYTKSQKTCLFLSSKELKKIKKFSPVLYEDYIKSEEYKKGVFRYMLYYSNIIYKIESLIKVIKFSDTKVYNRLIYLKKIYKIKTNYKNIFITKYDEDVIKNSIFKEIGDLMLKYDAEIDIYGLNKNFYYKYLLTKKKLEKCQSKLSK